jgi:Polyketide cyclase / dehydrase and lipid transport
MPGVKELLGHAAGSVDASAERCLALLREVDAYPAWYPEVVREVVVIERAADGVPSVVRTTLRVSVARFTQDVHVLMRVSTDQSGVTLTRVPHEPSDQEEFVVGWEVAGGAPAQVTVTLSARLDVPRLLPLGGLGDSIAAGFLAAASAALAAPS